MPDDPPVHEILRSEAELIIARLRLLETLGRYGRAEVVGSVALDLVVKRDIDIHILVGAARWLDAGLKAVVSDLWPKLLELDGVSELRLSDHRDVGALKIGIGSASSGTA